MLNAVGISKEIAVEKLQVDHITDTTAYKNFIVRQMEISKSEYKNLKDKNLGETVSRPALMGLAYGDYDSYYKGEYLAYQCLVKLKVDKEGNVTEDRKSVCDINSFLAIAHEYDYFTPNLYNKRGARSTKDLQKISYLTLDFDLNKLGVTMSPQELAYHIYRILGTYPHYINPSKTKGNYHTFMRITDLGGSESAVKSYKLTAKALSKILGSDSAAISPVQLFRTPSSFVTVFKSFDKKTDYEKLWQSLTPKYNPNGTPIALLMDIKAIERTRDVRMYNDNTNISSKVKLDAGLNLAKASTYKRILNDKGVQALLNGHIDEGRRNNAVFTVGLLYRFLGKSCEEAKEFIEQGYYDAIKEVGVSSFSLQEALFVVEHAYHWRIHGKPSAEWVEIITGVQCNVSFGKRSAKPTPDKKKKVGRPKKEVKEKKPISLKGLETRNKILRWLVDRGSNPFHLEDIADVLGVSNKTITRHLKSLEEDKLIDKQYHNNQLSQGIICTVNGVADNQFKQDELKPEIKIAKEDTEQLIDVESLLPTGMFDAELMAELQEESKLTKQENELWAKKRADSNIYGLVRYHSKNQVTTAVKLKAYDTIWMKNKKTKKRF